MNKTIVLFLLLVLAGMGFSKTTAQPLTRILFVFDASNSMNAQWQSQPKIAIARKLLQQSMDELQGVENVELALRVYGHQTAITPGNQDCNDTRLEVSFRPNNNDLIKRTLDKIVPKGTTPIAISLEKAAGDFPDCKECRNIIILITDGIEACDGDPCAVSRALQSKGIILKPFVIGVGLDADLKDTFSCVGNYFDAGSEAIFKSVLDVVIAQALNNTTAQINLLNAAAKPTESDVTVNIFNHHSKELVYGFVHTLNHRGNPDTLTLDPLLSYDIEVHTIPLSEKQNVSIQPGIHNIIAIDAPQGYLEINSGTRSTEKVPAIVRRKGSMTTVNVQNLGSSIKYLTGMYDLEILTLPRTYISDVAIEQSHTTTVTIPEPGVLNLSFSTYMYGSIAKIDGSNLPWVINLSADQLNQQFVLQPGRYRITMRSKNSKQNIYSIAKEVEIKSGQTTRVTM